MKRRGEKKSPTFLLESFRSGRIHLRVSGEVQGVFYRASAAEQARSLGLTGWVRNDSDGSVELVAEGEALSLRKLWEWCQQGPIGARVDQVQMTPEQKGGKFADFSIRR